MVHFCFFIFSTIQEQISTEQIALIAYVAFFVFAIVIVFVIFFMTFQRRKNQLLLDKINQQKTFDAELVKTQQEIQEVTLKHVGRELHDNIGQLLVMSTMQMNAASKVVREEAKSKVDYASEILKETLAEVRALSKSLNSDLLYKLGFDATVNNEIERLNKTGLIKCSLTITGKKMNFENKKDGIILFRILQEFSANVLKYAEAEHLKVTIDYKEREQQIKIEDDGKGFDIAAARKGSGLINMEKRAEMINAEYQLESQLDIGTTLILNYPYRLN